MQNKKGMEYVSKSANGRDLNYDLVIENRRLVARILLFLF
jgi:hypothetical protein